MQNDKGTKGGYGGTTKGGGPGGGRTKGGFGDKTR